MVLRSKDVHLLAVLSTTIPYIPKVAVERPGDVLHLAVLSTTTTPRVAAVRPIYVLHFKYCLTTSNTSRVVTERPIDVPPLEVLSTYY